MNDLTIVGTITIDRLHFRDHTRESFGGAPWFATELSDLSGIKVGIVTNVGKDFPIEKISKPILKASKIDATHKKTTTLDIFPDQKGVPAIVKDLTGRIRSLDSLEGKVVVVSPLFQEVSTKLIKKLKKKFTTIVIDIQGFTRPPFKQNIKLSDKMKKEPKELSQLCKVADIIKFNENELNAVLPGLSLRKKLTALHSWGVNNIVITQADKACLISRSNEQLKTVPVKPVETSDTVGAGDKFLILLGTFLAKNNSLENSVINAQRSLQTIMEKKV